MSPCNRFSVNHFVDTKIGGSTFDSISRRHVDLLNYARFSHIIIVVHATVDRILLVSSTTNLGIKPTGIGVIFSDGKGGYHHAMLREHREIILSTDAIDNPQPLMLSCIGPRPYLSSVGIPIVILMLGNIYFIILNMGSQLCPLINWSILIYPKKLWAL